MSYPPYAAYSQEKRPATGALIAAGIAFAAVLAVLYFTVARRPEGVSAPAAFRPYTASDRAFGCLAPDGWKRRSTAAQAVQSGVEFSQGSASIQIHSDLTGSLLGDVLRAQGAAASGVDSSDPGAQDVLQQLPPQAQMQMAADQREAAKPPVQRLHEQGRRALESQYTNYAEQPMQTFQSALGEARYSEWTGEQEGFLAAGKLHGYRVTILGNERLVTVVCISPEGSWSELQPAFRKVIGSLNVPQG